MICWLVGVLVHVSAIIITLCVSILSVRFVLVCILMDQKCTPLHLQSENMKKDVKTDRNMRDCGYDRKVSLPLVFFECSEAPAEPHCYLRHFEITLLHLNTARWICDKRVAASHFSDSNLSLVSPEDIPSSFLTLNEIEKCIQEEVEKEKEWKVRYILFYDIQYKRFELLVKENVPQCVSFVFRVLVTEGENAARIVSEREEHEVGRVHDVEGQGEENELFISPCIKSLLAEDRISNPSFPSEMPNKPPFIFSPSRLYLNTAWKIKKKIEDRYCLLLEEANKRRSLLLEGGAHSATLQAAHTLSLSDIEFMDRCKLFILEVKEKEKIIHKMHQRLLKEVREFIQNGQK